MSSASPIAEPVIRKLWQHMAEIYGHKWTSAYGEDAGASAGQTWAKGLAGLTAVQVGAGIRAALASAEEWPPTLPKFRAMCFGVPSFGVVRGEINARDSKRSPFALLVWSRIDGVRYRAADADRADRLLREAYDEAVEHIVRGGELPEPRAEISAPVAEPRKPASPEVARKHLESLMRLVAKEEDEPIVENRMEQRA